MKRVCVIDGQGGGIGSVIIRRLKEVFEESIEIVALGTNAIATAQMLKAKANKGASGENAIAVTSMSADIIIGPISIIMTDSMLGEVSWKISSAISKSPALKFLIPLTKEPVTIVGADPPPLPELVDILIEKHLKPILL